MTIRSVRLLRKGDVITYASSASGEDVTDTVVNVAVVATMANGETVTLGSSDEVDVAPPEDLADVAEQLAELGSESTE